MFCITGSNYQNNLKSGSKDCRKAARRELRWFRTQTFDKEPAVLKIAQAEEGGDVSHFLNRLESNPQRTLESVYPGKRLVFRSMALAFSFLLISRSSLLPAEVVFQLIPGSAAAPVASNTAKVSARAYGAQCSGKTDDTAAIQAALDVQSTFNISTYKTVNVDVELPQGTCMLSAPLRMGMYGSLTGQNDGTTLFANYSGWHGNNYAAIDVSISGRVPSGESVGLRRISNLRLYGNGNAGIPDSVGIYIHNQDAVYDQAFQIPYFNIEDVMISGFDTGIEAEDWLSSSINNVNITAVRQGIFLNGHDVNIQIGHTNLAYSADAASHTSHRGATVGLLLAANAKFCTNCTNYPQGISFHDSSVVAFDYCVWVSQAITVDVHDNVLDYAGRGTLKSGAGVQISTVGGGLYIHHNYIALQPDSNAYGVYSTANATDGIWIESNYFTNYAAKNNSDIGIAVSGRGQTKDWHINANTFINYRQGIYFNQAPSYSEVRNNFGSGTTGALINLAGVPGLAYQNMFVDGNTNDTSAPVVKRGTATGVVVGDNSGPGQITGTFTASGAGCRFAAGAMGNHCTANVQTPFNMLSADFKVHGCTVSGADGVTTIGGANPTSPSSFAVVEASLSATASGGGTITCEISQ